MADWDWDPNDYSKVSSLVGTAAGSFGGPIGSGIGGTLGALLPHLVHKLSGSTNKGKQGKSVTGYDFNQNPDVQNIRKLWEASPYNKPFNAEESNQNFNTQIADPANKYYQEKIRPGIESKYSNPDTTGGSALRNAINSGAEDLGGSLGEMRSKYLQNAQQTHANGQYNQIAQQLGLANNQANENYFDPNAQEGNEVSGWLEQLLGNKDFMKALQEKIGGKTSNESENNYGYGNLSQGDEGGWQVPGQLSSQSPGTQSKQDFLNNYNPRGSTQGQPQPNNGEAWNDIQKWMGRAS
jgi:hypothetical protein